jgi:type I restriction enzyme S subunit
MSKAEYKRLGDYIREVNVRNRELKVTKLVGLTIDKAFIPSVANVIGTDLSNYKVIRKEQFACSLIQVSRDGKMPVAMFEEDEAIMSPAYPMFEVVDKTALMPQYLMMWFSRSEFDREASYYAVGGVRGSLTWEDFCNMQLPIPSFTRQREIESEYETLTNRIRLNNQMIQHLEATAQALYRKTFVDNIDKENLPDGWRMGTIGEFGVVITGKTPSSDNPEDFGNDMPFVTPGDFGNYHKFAIGAERELSEIGVKRLNGKVLPKGSVIVTCIGSDMGKVTIASEECITNQQMNSIIVNRREYSDYLFYVLSFMSKELRAMALGSSTMPLLNKSDFEKIRVVYPPSDILAEFSQLLSISNEMILLKMKENEKLTELQSLLLAKMGQ